MCGHVRVPTRDVAKWQKFLEGSCALVFPTGHLSVGGAGMQIEAHDWVIRLNGHNAPKKFSRDAKDMGSRTDVRAITCGVGEHRVGPFHFVREESGKLVDVFHVFS